MHIPRLQFLAKTLLSQPSWAIDMNETSELTRAVEDLDGKLAEWAKQIPASWSYKIVKRMNYSSDLELSSSSFIPYQIHRYPDYYAARVWNLYRVYRLIIQSLLLRVYSLPSLHGADHHYDCIEKINKTMVADVCASVPFLLGYDLSDLKHSLGGLRDENFLWPQSSTKVSISGHTGKFSLIWPLYVASSVPSIPQKQQYWMRAQLRWIAETGEAYAHCLQDADSQTLIGEPEYFRFDCV